MDTDGKNNIQPALWTKRAMTSFVDLLVIALIGHSITLLLEQLVLSEVIFSLAQVLFGIIINFMYFYSMEKIWGKTIGKFFFKTKVIAVNGGLPTGKQIVIRTIARFIPFEFFTFFRSRPVGWHDQFSKTLVVDASN